MTITADHITPPDTDGRRWLVRPGDNASWEAWTHEDRLCDLCDGAAFMLEPDYPCVECHGTGRHIFTIEVAEPWDKPGEPCGTLLVHVVPDMVLPTINEDDLLNGTHPVVLIDPYDEAHVLDGIRPRLVTLPPAAKPGMWAVQLQEVRP